MKASISQVVDNGSFQLGQGQLESMMTDIAAGFIGTRATGQAVTASLDALGSGGGCFVGQQSPAMARSATIVLF
jgi:hypothetical protein